jgi:hypothetical protein
MSLHNPLASSKPEPHASALARLAAELAKRLEDSFCVCRRDPHAIVLYAEHPTG